tara:strand:- start:102 stop:356 length:255 start_codon:yes stop_codon:yes gene_type:complete
MTVRVKLENMLIKRGMSEQQVDSVMIEAIPVLQELTQGYTIDLESDGNSYPDIIYNILFDAIKPTALKWISENKPEAWFKPMFQ